MNNYGWNETVMIQAAISNLKDLAIIWYNSLDDLNHTWSEWRELLVYSFPKQHFEERLIRGVKKIEKSMVQFYYEKLALIRSCGFFGDGSRSSNRRIKYNISLVFF